MPPDGGRAAPTAFAMVLAAAGLTLLLVVLIDAGARR
jgi:hypothetical protein